MRKDITLNATLQDCERMTSVEDLWRFGGLLAQYGFRISAGAYMTELRYMPYGKVRYNPVAQKTDFRFTPSTSSG